MSLVVGLVSDTHGLLRPQALQALAGCTAIVHAGDIGDPAILEALRGLAPVTAVRGNNDRAPWAGSLPLKATLAVGGLRLLVVHEIADLGPPDAPVDADVVVHGHSHRPGIGQRAGALVVNPGSAGPRRFRLPVTVARLTVEAGRASARIVELALG